MILQGVINRPAVINIDPIWWYDSELKQAFVKYNVIFDGSVFEKRFDLTAEQTELWWENDSYVIDVLCQANGFTRETIQVETQAPVEEDPLAKEVE